MGNTRSTYSSNVALPLGSSSIHLNNIYKVSFGHKNLLSIVHLCIDNHVPCAFDTHYFYIFDRSTGSLFIIAYVLLVTYHSAMFTCLVDHRQLFLSLINHLSHLLTKFMSYLCSNRLLSPMFKFKISFSTRSA